MAVAAWENGLPGSYQRKMPHIAWVVALVGHAPEEFPFVTAARTMTLIPKTGDQHLKSLIQPGINALLTEPKRRFDDSPNDFRHTQSHTFRNGEDHVDTRTPLLLQS